MGAVRALPSKFGRRSGPRQSMALREQPVKVCGPQRSTTRVAAAAPSGDTDKQGDTTMTSAVKLVRLRGGGGESQAQMNALVELSRESNALSSRASCAKPS